MKWTRARWNVSMCKNSPFVVQNPFLDLSPSVQEIPAKKRRDTEWGEGGGVRDREHRAAAGGMFR